MFWSLVLEPSKRYSSTVKETFHLSMAALDMKTAKNDNDTYPVLIEVDDQELVLCNLSKSRSPHANLDLVFESGTEITFSTSGKATIHLTGYLTGGDNFDSDQDSDGDYSSSEESENVDTFNSNSKNNKASKGLKEDKKNIQQFPTKRKLEQAETGSKKKSKFSDDDSSTDLDENALGKLVDSLNDENITSSEPEDESDDDNSGSLSDFSLDDEEEEEEEDESTEDSEDEKPKLQKTPKNKKGKDASPQKTPQNKTPVSTKKDKNKLNGNTPGTGKKDKNQTPKPEQKTPKNKDQKANQTPQTPKNANATPKSQKKQTLPGGVTIEELKSGNGPVAKSGKMVGVYYTGRLKNNNRVFDQSNQGSGFKFRLGNNEVIKGWDVGLNGMKVGSKRRITCPPAMAYGNKGSPPQIPPNSWLVFDVELKSVN